jgi:phage baseplate assembly protein W
MPTIKIPFSISPNGTVSEITDAKKAIEQRITDVLVTTKNERTMRPAYGAGMTELLFEPVDDLLYGEFRIDGLDELTRSVTGVTIQDLSIIPADSSMTDVYETSLYVGVTYKVGPFDNGSVSIYLGDPNTITEESTL